MTTLGPNLPQNSRFSLYKLYSFEEKVQKCNSEFFRKGWTKISENTESLNDSNHTRIFQNR